MHLKKLCAEQKVLADDCLRNWAMPGLVTRSETCPTDIQKVIRSSNISYQINSMPILSLPMIQVQQLSVTG